ncbi:exodeoxyribonuclease V subunit beta [Leucothrix sargassi]|nr:exodeoxyribonuclease V subunit beta [Leucothrix sargassi]
MSEQSATPLPFNAFHTELESGINLIEASAGTGKTFSIAMLVLRFVAENNLPIEKILVVTFTKAATQELRTRIAQRLQDLRRYIVDPTHPNSLAQDDAFKAWAEALEDKSTVIERVVTALASIDNASIFTIHSFCQRMLRQYALESGQLFDAELSSDVEQLRLSLAEDYWRQQLYGASEHKVAMSCGAYKTPAALLSSISAIQEGMVTEPSNLDLDGMLAKLDSAAADLKWIGKTLLGPLEKAIADDPSLFKPAYLEVFEPVANELRAWLSEQDGALPLSSLAKVSYSSLMSDALNGNKFRKNKEFASGEERKQAFLSTLGINDTDVIDGLLEKSSQISLAFRLGLYDYLKVQLEDSQSKLNVLSFNDLISRLSQVLSSDGQGDLLRAALRRQFAVAMIDEFQDTDQQQWHIFSSVYNTETHFLYLIGDPKQAIYKFRGADIYSYLAAKDEAKRAYTLDTNFRSHPNLVEAVNAFFAKSEVPFLLEDIPYYPVKAGKSGSKIWWNKVPADSMVMWQLDPNPEDKTGYWTSGVVKQLLRTHIINEIIQLLDPDSGATFGSDIESAAPLAPQHIAILVRGNEEAANYQQQLQKAGIPAVLNSKHSVFDSLEAVQLSQLLVSLVQPANQQTLKQALALPWFGLSGQQFDALCADDMKLQAYVSDFQEFQQRWQQHGLMAMMRALLDKYQVLQTLTTLENAERRIANLNHLLELLQQAALDERLDTHKTIEWLTLAIQGEQGSDGKELRLEQDEAAVSIVTIHSSKGLEYPVVFCPELWAEKRAQSAPSGDKVVICHEDNSVIADLGTPKQEERFKQSQFEQSAEDLRLLYVAVTRAAYRCYVPWAYVRSAKKDNTSALAHLLEPHAGADLSEKFKALAQSSECFSFDTLAAEVKPLQAKLTTKTSQSLVARDLSRDIKQQWQMSSYSALAHLGHASHVRPDSELPQDKSEEPQVITEVVAEAEPELIPKGAHTGNVLHDLLENNSFNALSELDPENNTDEHYLKQRTRCCLRYGLSLDDDGLKALDALLVKSVKAPLDAEDTKFTLANIDDAACLKEMPFYFAINHMQTQQLNKVLSGQATCQDLSSRSLTGQLTGFIDLICEYQGRYYVMDYKSNWLSSYDPESMQAAMHEHNYGLQYFIYSVVLHHYLKQRLPNYSYDEHFGGVRYLFLRGMDETVPMNGVFVDKPTLEIIERLSDVLAGEVK